jgi:tRNA pseudouridine38-40 synthase
MRTFRLTLEYDGRGFEGWQLQPAGHPTLQGALEAAFLRVTGQSVRVLGASRTDAGVHAEAQVASASLDTALAAPALQRALNGVLPPQVAVVALEEAPGFDVRRAARSKLYRYRIWNGAVPSPLRRDRSWWVRPCVDLGAMRRAAAHLVGHHDFSAFRAAHSEAKTTDRTLREIRIDGESGAQIDLDVHGDGFLRHMIRILAGTLVEVGRGRRRPDWVIEVLASRDRRRAGVTAPPEALTLVRVFFDSDGKSSSSGPGPA